MQIVLGSGVSDMMTVISAAVTPVVLISALAIFFSALTAKHSHLSDQFRQLSAELRKGGYSDARHTALLSQLRIFEQRLNCLWTATGMLAVALMLFVLTVLDVIWSRLYSHTGHEGLVFLILGLVLLVTSVMAEFWEIALGRRSMMLEVSDITFKADSKV